MVLVTVVSALGGIAVVVQHGSRLTDLLPAVIGFVAHATSLPVAFALIAAAFLVVAACFRVADR